MEEKIDNKITKEKRKPKDIAIDILVEIVGNFMLSFATYNIAAGADFAVSGFSGIALILFKLFNIPMGTTIFLLNLPFALLCMKIIGVKFILKSLRCIAIQSIMMNYVVVHLPILHTDKFIAMLLTGVIFGIYYAKIYLRGSSTGGLDFIIMLLKRRFPHIKTGTISFALDIVTLVAAGIVFRDYEAAIYGTVIVFISSTTIDKITLGRNSGGVIYAIVNHGEGKAVCDLIDKVCDRGSTILEGRGGYKEEKKDVVMVVGSTRDIYLVQAQLKTYYPDAFVIVMDSKEVQGEGFSIAKVAGDE